MSAPFGVYVHIPFCASRCDYCDFATWTDRAHLSTSTSPRASPTSTRRAPAARRRRACSSAAARRRCSRPASSRAILDAIDRVADARGHRRVQPRQVDARQARARTRTRGVNRVSVRRAVDGPARARRARAHARSRRTSRARSSWRARRGFDRAQPRPDLRHAGRVVGRLAGDARRRARARGRARRARTRSRSSRARRSGRQVAAGARRARRRRPGRQVRAGRRRARRGRARVVRGLELGAARRGVPPQPPLLERRRVPRDRLRGARPHRTGARVVERAHARALHRRDRAPAPRRRRATRPSTPRGAGRGGARRWRCGREAGSSSPIAGADASPAVAACSTTSTAAGLLAAETTGRVVLTRRRSPPRQRRSRPGSLGALAAAGPRGRWHSVRIECQ